MNEFQQMYHDQTRNISSDTVITMIHMTASPYSEKQGLANAWCATHGENSKVRSAVEATHREKHNIYK